MRANSLKDVSVAYRAVQFKSPYAPLIDELYREEVLEARDMSPEEKFCLGEELFDYACEVTLAGIRNQNASFSEEECERELERRLDWAARMERVEHSQ